MRVLDRERKKGEKFSIREGIAMKVQRQFMENVKCKKANDTMILNVKEVL